MSRHRRTTKPHNGLRFLFGCLFVLLLVTNSHFTDAVKAEDDKPKVQKAQPKQVPTPTQGQGWTLSSNTGLKRHQTYTVAFRDEKSRKALKPYVVTGINQLNAMPEMKSAGIKFTFTEKNHPRKMTDRPCSEPHTFVFVLADWNQTEKPYAAYALGCNVWVHEPGWNQTAEFQKRNVTTHELGHLLGLDHCEKEAGLNPIMCEEGEPTKLERHGLFREPDLEGIRHLIKRSS